MGRRTDGRKRSSNRRSVPSRLPGSGRTRPPRPSGRGYPCSLRRRPISLTGSIVPISRFACIIDARSGSRRRLLLQVFHVDHAVRVDPHVVDLEAEAFQEIRLVHDRIMLDIGKEDPVPSVPVRQGEPFYGQIVRFGRRAVKMISSVSALRRRATLSLASSTAFCGSAPSSIRTEEGFPKIRLK